MPEVKWIKISTGMFESNRKIKQIELMPEGDTILVIWLKLLLLAGNINDGGQIYLTPEIPYTEEMLANELRRPLNTVRMALTLFEKFGMIENEDGVLNLSSWEKYQSTDRLAEIKEQNRRRQAKHKASQKALKESNVTVTLPVTLGNATEEEREEERERDKEIDKERDSKKERKERKNTIGQSFVQPSPSVSFDFEDDYLKQEIEYEDYLDGDGFLVLSAAQKDDLLQKLSLNEYEHYTGVIKEQERKGNHYKSKTHYQAILDMVAQDRQIQDNFNETVTRKVTFR